MGTIRNEPPARTAWMVWIALAFSIVAYLGIGIIVRQQSTVAPMGEQLNILRIALLAAALGMSAVNLLLPRMIGAKMLFFQLAVVRWALAESIAIFGFVLFFMGETLEVFLLFVAWSLGFFILLAPTAGARRRHAQLAGDSVTTA